MIEAACQTTAATTTPIPPKPPRLLDQLRDAIRVRHYGLRTEKTTTIYTHVLPTGPLGVRSPADTPDPGTDVGLMLRQMETLMRKLAPLAARLPGQPAIQGECAPELSAPGTERPAP